VFRLFSWHSLLSAALMTMSMLHILLESFLSERSFNDEEEW
jgi:hypothetical protein